jgi:hypothetical protein
MTPTKGNTMPNTKTEAGANAIHNALTSLHLAGLNLPPGPRRNACLTDATAARAELARLTAQAAKDAATQAETATALRQAIATLDDGRRLDWGDLSPFARALGYASCADFTNRGH